MLLLTFYVWIFADTLLLAVLKYIAYQSKDVSMTQLQSEQYSSITIGINDGSLIVVAEPTCQIVGDFGTLPRIFFDLSPALASLVEGGFVIDQRPLIGNPHLADWALAAPLSNGKLTGTEVERFPPIVREAARQLLMELGGTFNTDTFLAATSEPVDGSDGAFTLVSAEYLALYRSSSAQDTCTRHHRRSALSQREAGNV